MKTTCRRAVCVVFMVIFYAPFYFIPRSHSQEAEKFQIILLKVRDFSGAGIEGLEEKMADALRFQLQQTPFFETLNPELLETWLLKTKIVTTDEETAYQVAKGIGLDGVFIADILKISTDKETKETWMGLQLQLIDKKGEIISRAIVSAGSGKKPKYYESTELRLQKAMYQAEWFAIQETVHNLTTKGIVTYIKGSGIVAANLSASNGLKKGAELLVTRNEVKIAKMLVIEVHKTNCYSQVYELVKGKFISPSDDVRITYNPF